MNQEVTIRAHDQAGLEEAMAKILRKCGWNVEKMGGWITCQELAGIYRVSDSRLSMQLKRFDDPFPVTRGPSGRILKLQLSAPLKKYLDRLNGKP